MNFLIAASGDTLESKVDKRFGHPAFHILLDSLTMEFQAFPGPEENASAKIWSKIAGIQIEGIIAGNIGPNAYDKVHALGIKVYICRNMTVREAVEKALSGQIKPISESTMKTSVRGGKGQGKGKRR